MFFLAAAESTVNPTYSLIVMSVGIAIVLGLIIFAKANAFMALITAAMVVSLCAPGEMGTKITRVAEAFGSGCGSIGIVIALAAVIGQCMMDSGAADRVVRGFMHALGEKRAPIALMGSGYVLAVPVFFDTVFYLLVPLARSFYRKTRKNYLKCILAIGAGGAITHTLVPPTPGPLTMAATLDIDLGYMIVIGALVAFPAAIAGLICAGIMDRLMPIPMRTVGNDEDMEPIPDDQLPGLFVSLLPVLLPVLMIACNTATETAAKQIGTEQFKAYDAADATAETKAEIRAEHEGKIAGTALDLMPYMRIIGNPNFALLISTVIALWLLYVQKGPTLKEMSDIVEVSLMSGGVIILITAGGVAFGSMLKVAQVGDAIAILTSPGEGATMPGMTMLFLCFGVASLLKVAQGSSTAAMIITSSMMAPLVESSPDLGFHPVYLATAIGAGSLVGSWMNDSGFWIFAKMGGLTEGEALKSWTVMLVVLGVVSMAMTLFLATVMPLV
ncbi:MAG: SLC13 family permease [Planctomycetaceae bacterium]|nr:SLC13 family permease [Planctomycetaceae bacterium]